MAMHLLLFTVSHIVNVDIKHLDELIVFIFLHPCRTFHFTGTSLKAIHESPDPMFVMGIPMPEGLTAERIRRTSCST